MHLEQTKSENERFPQSDDNGTEKVRSTATTYMLHKARPKGRRFTNKAEPQRTETLSVDTRHPYLSQNMQTKKSTKT